MRDVKIICYKCIICSLCSKFGLTWGVVYVHVQALAQIQFIGRHAGDEPPLTNPSHIFQSAAGFLSYFVVMGENGFLPYTLIGLRERWEDPTAIVTDSYGQDWVRICWSLCQNFYQLVLIGLCSAPELAVLGFHCLLRCHRGITMDRPYDMQDAQEFFLSSRTEVWGYGEGGVVMEGWKDGDGDKGIVERLHDLHSLLCILCGISTI